MPPSPGFSSHRAPDFHAGGNRQSRYWRAVGGRCCLRACQSNRACKSPRVPARFPEDTYAPVWRNTYRDGKRSADRCPTHQKTVNDRVCSAACRACRSQSCRQFPDLVQRATHRPMRPWIWRVKSDRQNQTAVPNQDQGLRHLPKHSDRSTFPAG